MVLSEVPSILPPFRHWWCITACITNSLLRLLRAGQNTSCDFQQQEAGVTPEARRDRGRDFAARWGRSRLSSCFVRVSGHPVLLVHPVVSSAAYVLPWVTLGVKSPAKGRLPTLFQGDFTKLLGCRSKSLRNACFARSW